MLLGHSVTVPKLLLKRYRDWHLDENSLLILLRILDPLLKNGRVRFSEITEEFDITVEDIPVLLHPLLENRMISLDKGGRAYRCPGLMRYLYEGWLDDQRLPESEDQSAVGMDSKQRIRSISRLYHRFEADFGRQLRYSENEKIRMWVDDDHFSPELIEEALRRATLQSKTSLAYVDSILRSWLKKGFSTVEQVKEGDVKSTPASRKQPDKTKEKDSVLSSLEAEMMKA